jgi:hypothetical protein
MNHNQIYEDTAMELMEEHSEVIEAAGILIKLSRDPRLTPTALDRFRATGTRLKISRAADYTELSRGIRSAAPSPTTRRFSSFAIAGAVNHKPMEKRKRKFKDFAKPTVSEDIAIYEDVARPTVLAKSRMANPFPTPDADNAGVQGMDTDVPRSGRCSSIHQEGTQTQDEALADASIIRHRQRKNARLRNTANKTILTERDTSGRRDVRRIDFVLT